MNLKAPLLETAQELFATLTRINPQLEVRKRYDILRSILNIAVEQQLTDVTIKLSGLYAKIDYLIKKHQISQNDRSLSFAINDARVRLSDLTATTDEELQKAWSQDLKAIAQFISLIYDAPIPAQLAILWKNNLLRFLLAAVVHAVGRTDVVNQRYRQLGWHHESLVFFLDSRTAFPVTVVFGIACEAHSQTQRRFQVPSVALAERPVVTIHQSYGTQVALEPMLF